IGKPAPSSSCQNRQRQKNALRSGTIDTPICFAAIWFFRRYRDFRFGRAGRRIDVPLLSRKYGRTGVTEIASEGQILVSSTTEQRSAGTSDDGTGAPSPKKGRGGGRKEQNQVSQALRTVYQRAVDEDIPSEMLDLLSKLD
ncbi:MAG: NepR family anti-sigma factor, partial [Pseudomonadota bacterium]|nr:NepR family anti-sigma factor [Pseudomonadota bacterium]